MEQGKAKLKSVAAVVAMAVASVWLFGSIAVSGAATRPAPRPEIRAVTNATTFTDIPVTGTTSSGGTFEGTLNVTKVVSKGGGLFAVGTLSGVFKDSGGAVTDTLLAAPVRIPITAARATCKILHLELGPLDLNLLGLMVHLNKVVLDITAQSGPGNLLGNLLCAIAHLLDGSLTGSTLNDTIAQLLTGIIKLVNALNLIA